MGLTYCRFKIFLDKLYVVDISATFTFPSFIYLQHKVVLFTFEVETQKKIRSLRNTKWDELHEEKMQHNFTFINILKVIFDKYWGRGALMQSSQLLSDRLKESKLRKLAVRSTSVRLPNDWSLADGCCCCWWGWAMFRFYCGCLDNCLWSNHETTGLN